MHHIVDEDPEDPRHFIPNVEFYITNVCNLTCSNCNRFNNYDFKGWQRWSDYEPMYEKWAQHVRLQRVTILGGEPLLNPTLVEWVDGINRLWNKSVQVLTNGSRLNQTPGLYENLIKWHDPKQPWIKNWIGISLHNSSDLERCFDEVRKFMQGSVEYYHRDDPRNVNNGFTLGGTHAFYDSNGMRVVIWEANDFYSAAVQQQGNRYKFWNTDPAEAHRNCGFVMYKCYHFIKGALYKCGPVALFPEFDQQFGVDLTDEDRKLINSYRPLVPGEFAERGAEFLATIDDVIPQCKFCPGDKDIKMYPIQAVSKKSGSTGIYD